MRGNTACRATATAIGRGASIAIVDDDPGLRRTLAFAFTAEGFRVESFSDGQSAFEKFNTVQPDLAMIDLTMPRMSGLDLLEKIRANWDFPVIVLTAHDDEIDEVLGLRMGADDFVRKPCSMRMLAERVRARLRRVRDLPPQDVSDAAERVISRGPLTMDARRHAVSWNGTEVDLTATEFLLLEALASRPGFVRSRSQLMDAAYDEQVYVDDRTIDSHIKRLRQKLRAKDPAFRAIETLYGIGYRYSDAQTG